MAADGYQPIGFDGESPQGNIWNNLPAPFEVYNVRPDACGIAPDSGDLALCEAKTANDLSNSHTLRQFRIFGQLLQRANSKLCQLYVAVPYSAIHQLDSTLARLNLVNSKNIVRLHIPDCFLVDNINEQ